MSFLGRMMEKAKVFSPAKPVNGEQSSDTVAMSRGIKRKADPYEVEDEDDNQEKKTPSTQRVRSRVSSEAPNSAAKSRLASGKKRRSRSVSKRPDSKSGAAAATAAEDQEADETPAQLNGQSDEAPRGFKVPVADMGSNEFIANDDDDDDEPVETAESSGSAKPPIEADAKEVLETAKEKIAEAKEKIAEKRADKKVKVATKEKEAAKDADADADADAEAEADAEVDAEAEAEAETDNVQEIQKLLKHRRLSDGTIEVLVQWVGESEEDATFEPEAEIQRGAEETLLEYWDSIGGRSETLFYKPKNPPAEVYHVFQILKHEKKGTTFQCEVQWVGYPATPGNTTMEPEYKLKKTAPELLEQYWESKGGRSKFLAKRGRAKKD